ncbi:hypothetical protein [[Eubacterium] cellulosolvens]
MVKSELPDFENITRTDELAIRADTLKDDAGNVQLPHEGSPNPSTEPDTKDNQDKRIQELKYSFSPDDELLNLTEEMLYRAANPKKIGILSSGGLSNNIIEKLQVEYPNMFKDYSFETTYELFDPSLSAHEPGKVESIEGELFSEKDEEELEFEPDPGHEIRREIKESEGISEYEEPAVLDQTKPLTFRERAQHILYELKKKLGLVKPRKLSQEEINAHPVPETRPEPELEPEPIVEPKLEPEPLQEPVVGEVTKNVVELLEEKDILFIFTCLDDEHDIENSLVLSEIAKKNNILSIVIVSLPRYFGKVENVYAANKILQRLRLIAEIVILIPYYETIKFKLIPQLIQELLEVIIRAGLINVDVADLKIIVKGGNVGIITFGYGKHATRHKDAFFEALDSKLLNVELGGVKKALLNVTGSKNITLAEVEGIANQVKNRIANGARFILGTSIDPKMEDDLKIFLLLGVTPMEVMVNEYANE